MATPDGYWGEDPNHPVDDWKFEVANGDTRLGYWEWMDGAGMNWRRARVKLWAALCHCIIEGRPVTMLTPAQYERQGELFA